MPLGHELAGVVENVGTNVTDHAPGERVVVSGQYRLRPGVKVEVATPEEPVADKAAP